MLITCPHCQSQLEASEEHAGMNANCPQCSGEFMIPAAAPPIAPPEVTPAEESSPGRMRQTVAFGPHGEQFYRSSGKFNFCRLIIGLNATILLAFVLALIYAYATRYIPFIYLNMLFTLGLGIAIGFAAVFMNIWARNRNRLLAFAGMFLVAVIALWFTWGFWVTTLFKEIKLFSVEALLAMHPGVIFSVAAEIMNTEGYMSIGRFARSGITGYGLLILWAVEALGIVGIAVWIFFKTYRSMSFCERCGNWTDTFYISPTLEAVEYEEDLRERLTAGDFGALNKLPKRNSGDNYTQYSIEGCPCGETLLVTVNDVKVSYNSKGDASTSERPFVKALYVTPETAEVLAKRK
ncbi:MAG: hypothetical protein V8T90_05070 [Victivallales bacterium]